MGSAFWKLYVNTEDIDSTYRRSLEAGATAISDPQDLDRWPVTIAFLEDPDGYQIELVQRRHT
jgi:lactoylglutathione lyase